MVAAYCSPEDACPGTGLGVTDSGLGLQILGATSVTYASYLHNGLLFDCALQSGQGQYLVQRVTRIVGTNAQRVAVAYTLFEGLRFYETDNDRELEYDGSNWVIMSEPLQTFTPTFTGVTDGSATKTGRYKRGDGYIDLYASWVYGAGSAVTGPVTLTLPINMHATALGTLYSCDLLDSGTTTYAAQIQVASVSSLAIAVQNSAGTNLAPSNISSSNPMTWTTGDSIKVVARYPMTTRYS